MVGNPGPKALATYGPYLPVTNETLLRFVDGRPVGAVAGGDGVARPLPAAPDLPGEPPGTLAPAAREDDPPAARRPRAGAQRAALSCVHT